MTRDAIGLNTLPVRQVADHLWHHALGLGAGDLSLDLFARSAINRYYYAVFLIARDLHRELYPGRRVPPHADFPNVVRNGIYGTFKDRIREASRARVLAPGPSKRLQHRVRELTSELHNLLNQGYGLRVTADYEPEIRIARQGASLALQTVTLDAASKWPDTAERLCGGIWKAWQELGH